MNAESECGEIQINRAQDDPRMRAMGAMEPSIVSIVTNHCTSNGGGTRQNDVVGRVIESNFLDSNNVVTQRSKGDHDVEWIVFVGKERGHESLDDAVVSDVSIDFARPAAIFFPGGIHVSLTQRRIE